MNDEVSKPSGLGKRLVLLCVTLLLVVLGLEVAARVIAETTGRRRGIEPDELLGWRPIAGVEKKDAVWCAVTPARINSRGWRDRETPLAKPPGKKRLVVVGDSFVFGQAVDYGDRFSEVLESEYPGLDVVNLGVCGYGADQATLAFESEGVRYAPDAAVLAICLANDLRDIRHDRRHSWPKPWFRRHGDDLELVLPFADWTVGFRNRSYLAEWVMQRVESGEAVNRLAPGLADDDGVDLLIAIAARFRSDCVAAGAAPFVFLIQPNAGRPGVRAPVTARLVEAFDRMDLPVIDGAAAFAGHDGAWADLHLPCQHWSPAGHRAVAAAMASALKAHGILP